MELQGVFLNVCCIYWSKSCRVAIAGLSQRYGEAIPKLLESGILKQKGGYAIIDFLNEQWVELYDRHEKNSKNGKLGNEKRWGKIATQSHIDKIREDKIRKEKIRKEPSEQSSGLYTSCLDLYFKWHESKLGAKPQFDGGDGMGLKAIIKHFNTLEAGDEAVLKNFNALLSSYDKWDKWHRGNTRLRQINSNLTNIINLLKNGKQGTINARTMSEAMEREFNPKHSDTTI